MLGNKYGAKQAAKLLSINTTKQYPVACTVVAAPPYAEMFWPVKASTSKLDEENKNRAPVWLDDLT